MNASRPAGCAGDWSWSRDLWVSPTPPQPGRTEAGLCQLDADGFKIASDPSPVTGMTCTVLVHAHGSRETIP
jgi:hypothetical protein